MAALLLFLTLLLNGSVSKPLCGGKMNAFMDYFDGDHYSCSCAQINQPEGNIVAAIPFPGCKDRTGASMGIPVSLFDYDTYGMFFMTGSGMNVYDIALSTGNYSIWGNLPTVYNYTIGMAQFDNTGLYIVTTSTLYFANESAAMPRMFNPIMSLASAQLSTMAVMTSSFWVPMIYILDTNMMLTTVDLTNPMAPKLSSMMISGMGPFTITTMSLYVPSTPYLPYLVGVGSNYNLYAIDPNMYTSTWIMQLPMDTPPYPRASTIMDNEMFYVDNVNLYDVDVIGGQILSQNPFNTQKLEGNIQIHP